MFRAQRFDPDEWAGLFREAGAGYVGPVAEHHDGFQMYESRLSDWNAKDMGPERNVLGELKAAAEKTERIDYYLTLTDKQAYAIAEQKYPELIGEEI